MRNSILLICFVLYTLVGHAQLNKAWEVGPKLSADEHIEQAIEATNGFVFAVGYTESMPGRKRDGLLVIIDTRNGQIIRSKNFGGRFNESFSGITQTNKGHFIIVGKTGSDTQGKDDAWIVAIDENGEQVWEKKFGGAGEDAFEGVTYNPEENTTIVAGFKDDRKTGNLWVLQLEEDQVLSEKIYGGENYADIKRIALSAKGEILVAGNKVRPKGQSYLLAINPNGQEKWNRAFGNNSEILEDLLVSSQGDILLAGSTVSRSDGEDVWVVALNQYGDELWKETYGGEDHDAAMSIAEAVNGGYYLLGRTLSHKDNARSERIYLLKISRGGEREYQRDYGGNKDDLGQSVLQLRNGFVFLAADSESNGAQAKDALFMAFQTEEDPMPDLRRMKSAIKFIDFEEDVILQTRDQQLKPNDISAIAVQIRNSSTIDLPNLSLRVDNSGAKGVQLWRTNYVGKLKAGSSKTVYIPVRANQALEEGLHNFSLTAMAGTETLESTSISLESKVPSAAKLALVEKRAEFLPGNRGSGGPIKVTMTLVNEGDFSTSNLQLRPVLPAGLQALNNQSQLMIGTLSPSGKRTVYVTFQPSTNYLNNRRDATLSFHVESNGVATQEPIRIDIPNLENPQVSSGLNSKTTIIWVDQPGTAAGTNRFKTSDPNAKIRLAIASSQRIRTEDIKVYLNKNEVEGNKNLAEEELIVPNNNYMETTYSRKISLKEGINEIYVQVNDGNSRRIVVEYEPRSRNLHVLAIGPNHPDLQYTGKDARDFAKTFQNQSGKLFNEVFITELSAPETTNKTEIIKAIFDLKNKFDNQVILPNDVLIVFISSHGVIGQGNRYKIIPSDYDPQYGDLFTIDYQNEILGPLSKVNCKKMIFIDACHSGAASSKGSFKDQRRSEMIFRLNAQSPGLSSITSCQSSEMSYEDDAWQNGAFTKAIIEGLNNQNVNLGNGTSVKASNDDDFVTLGELFEFVRRRVSDLVKTYKPNAPTEQNPELIKGTQALDEDLPLFETNN